MDSGYNSDYGFEDFYTSPVIQVFANCSYDEYCRKTGHQKVENPTPRKRGKSKGKITINCRASELAVCTSPSELIGVVKAVAVDDLKHEIVLGKTAKQPVVSKLSIEYVYLDSTCNKYSDLICCSIYPS